MNLRRLAFHPQKMLPCWKEKHLQRVRNKIPTVPSSMSAFRVHQTKNIWMQPPKDPKDWRVTLTLQPTQQKDQETLVGGFEHEFFMFSIYWECHHPNWLELHHFSEGLNHQPELVFLKCSSPTDPWPLSEKVRLTPESRHHTPVVLPKARLDP